jgi:phosphatidate cytidylyltransferase
MVITMTAILALLLFFSIIYRVMQLRDHPMAEEIKDRTVTWWWMVAIFILAFSTHKIVSFVFLGFLCFAALREYFSMLPMRQETESLQLTFGDRLPVLISYLCIPLIIYIAYIEWYNLFIILVPVYLFLLMPILLILQNRTTGTLKSLGILNIGFMFFLHNLGHCLFMINMGAMVLLFCFTLTETRDLVSFWVGKMLSRISAGMPDGGLKRMLDCRIAAEVSPNKTWSAGIASAIITGGLALALVPLLPAFPQGAMSFRHGLLFGVIIGMLGLFGDLAFSMVKRDIGVKDSGSVLPGHGGIIDRVDSLVFTIPVTFHLINWIYY